MTGTAKLYRKALPYWGALVIAGFLLGGAGAGRAASVGGGRLLAGIEPVMVIRAILQRPRQLGRVMLCFGLPTLARRAGEQDPLLREDLNLADSFWTLAVGVRYHTPQETFRAGLPILGYRPTRIVPRVELVKDRPNPQVEPEPTAPPPAVVVDPRTVIVFHTHTSEVILPMSGHDRLENGSGDIVKVGEYLTQALRAEGFNVVHDTSLHDQVPFRDAYRRSLTTASALIATNPDPLAVIDLHRDATPGVVGTIELGGRRSPALPSSWGPTASAWTIHSGGRTLPLPIAYAMRPNGCIPASWAV